MKYFKLFFLLVAISSAFCANILYLSSVPSRNNFIWCKTILESLNEKGHNITALSADIEESRVNFTYIHLEAIYSTVYNKNKSKKVDWENLTQFKSFQLFRDLSEKSCTGAVNSKGYKKLLNYPENFKIDVVIADFTLGPCLYGLVDKFKNPPLVGVSPSFGLDQLARTSGSLIFPAFVPASDLQFNDKMNFVERFESTINHAMSIAAFKYFIVPKVDKIVRKFHPKAPYLEEIEKQTGIYLISNNPMMNFKEPHFSNVRLVGGLHIKKPKNLTSELKSIADDAKDGLIFVSLGENFKLENKQIETILRTFNKLPQFTFLWKFQMNSKVIKNLPKNVKILSKLPQSEIFVHPNTKLFITDCNLLDIQEAIFNGVSVLTILQTGKRFFEDFQDFNKFQSVHRLVEIGVAEKISIKDLSEEKLFNLIKNMIESLKYQNKVKSISSAMRDRMETPLEEAVFWIEWLIRHPDVDLQGPASELNIFARHSLDVFAVIFMIILMLSF
jgi:glucuronosyltransferase